MRSVGNLSLLLIFLVMTSCNGCGGDSEQEVDPVLDYADMVRMMVMDLKNAEGGPRGAIDAFAENMEGYESEALGDHEATYAAIAKIAQELKSMKDSASDAELRAKVDELVALADKLPGESP
jgi:hypothetical protein